MVGSSSKKIAQCHSERVQKLPSDFVAYQNVSVMTNGGQEIAKRKAIHWVESKALGLHFLVGVSGAHSSLAK